MIEIAAGRDLDRRGDDRQQDGERKQRGKARPAGAIDRLAGFAVQHHDADHHGADRGHERRDRQPGHGFAKGDRNHHQGDGDQASHQILAPSWAFVPPGRESRGRAERDQRACAQHQGQACPGDVVARRDQQEVQSPKPEHRLSNTRAKQ